MELGAGKDAQATSLEFLFSCDDCETKYKSWKLYCNECDSWNQITHREGAKDQFSLGSIQNTDVGTSYGYSGEEAVGILSLADLPMGTTARIETGVYGLNDLFGGGIVPGSVSLLAGSPGSFKSTLALQVLDFVGQTEEVLYVSAEEGPENISGRAKRLDCTAAKMGFSFNSEIQMLISDIHERMAKLVVIDSLQAIHDGSVSGGKGGAVQVESCLSKLYAYANQNRVAMIVICQANKKEQFAGPRVVEHMGDAMFFMKRVEDSDAHVEIRTSKNRNGGSVREIELKIAPESGRLLGLM